MKRAIHSPAPASRNISSKQKPCFRDCLIPHLCLVGLDFHSAGSGVSSKCLHKWSKQGLYMAGKQSINTIRVLLGAELIKHSAFCHSCLSFLGKSY